MDIDKLVRHRVKQGYAENDSRVLLAALLKAHSGVNLDYALSYNGFTR